MVSIIFHGSGVMSSYRTPFIARTDKRFAIVPARLFNRTRYGPNSVCLRYNFPVSCFDRHVYKTKNVFRAYVPEEATKRMVFIIIAIVIIIIIIIKFDVARHFLIMARTEENITITVSEKWQLPPRTNIIYLHRRIRCGKCQIMF